MAYREKTINELNECIEHIRKNEFDKIPFWGNCQSAMMDALELLKEQEQIINSLKSDLQETLKVVSEQSNVIRCKDCKYAKEWNVNTIRCIINSNDLNAFHRANWFCADGEQRTEV